MTYPISVKGVLVLDGKVLLVGNDRAEWELPGGRLEVGEAPERALARRPDRGGTLLLRPGAATPPKARFSGVKSVAGSIWHCTGGTMNNPKAEVASMLERLPQDASFEDIQHHLYVLEKAKRGLQRTETEGAISLEDAKTRLSKRLAT